jgi:hypothetical protein
MSRTNAELTRRHVRFAVSISHELPLQGSMLLEQRCSPTGIAAFPNSSHECFGSRSVRSHETADPARCDDSVWSAGSTGLFINQPWRRHRWCAQSVPSLFKEDQGYMRVSARLNESHHPRPGIGCELFGLLMGIAYGGEGGIRTPDTLTGMSDFESGAFNRALPPLRVWIEPLEAYLNHTIILLC